MMESSLSFIEGLHQFCLKSTSTAHRPIKPDHYDTRNTSTTITTEPHFLSKTTPEKSKMQKPLPPSKPPIHIHGMSDSYSQP